MYGKQRQFQNWKKNFQKNFKKSIDKAKRMWYYMTIEMLPKWQQRFEAVSGRKQ